MSLYTRKTYLCLFALVFPLAYYSHTFARVNGNNKPVKTFHLENLGGEIGSEFYYIKEKQSNQDSDTLDYEHWSIEEYIQLRFRGYAYHPRFLDFNGRVKLGLVQQRYERSGTAEGVG